MLAVLASCPEVLRVENFNRSRRLRPRPKVPDIPVAIAFLARYGVSPAILQQGSSLALAQGTGADEALIASGNICSVRFYRALARHLHVPFVDHYMQLSPQACWHMGSQTGIAPLAPNAQGLGYVMAPRGKALSALLKSVKAGHRVRTDFAITTPQHLTRLALVSQNRRIASEASQNLAREHPGLSAVDRISHGQAYAGTGVALATILGVVLAPAPTSLALFVLCSVLFSIVVALRIWALAASVQETPVRPEPLADTDLPVYSVILPVYREKNVVRKLLDAVSALDYPHAKLDLKLVVESCDCETLAALQGCTLPPFCEVIIAPPGSPRTKPRAMNIALPFCRGQYLVIYDAEDEPDPGQLRLAAASFAASPDTLVCLQARLCIDNAADNWLTALFAIEYAALFDVMNPGYAALGQQFPLGGTSNHFRIDALRKAGGWDAWNVTEDADLGLRLARFGLHIGVLDSVTLEEAPAGLRAWRLQRQRWLKGWMQTLLTHSRNPVGLWREPCAAHSITALVLIAGCVCGALFGPGFFWATVYQIFAGQLFDLPAAPSAFVNYMSLTLFSAGVACCMGPLLLGMRRRKLLRLAIYLPLLPVYFLLMSVAAWGALIELCRNPFGWNKTEHGLARSSLRRASFGPPASGRPICATPKDFGEVSS